MQRGKKAFGVSAIMHRDIYVLTIRSFQLFAGVGTPQAGAGGSANHVPDAPQVRQNRDHRIPVTTEVTELRLDFRRHALGIEIEQHKSWLPCLKPEKVFGAGDEGWVTTIEFVLGGDFDPLWQVGAQRAECDGLIGAQLPNQLGKGTDTVDLDASRNTSHHNAGRAITLNGAVAV
jgi:hypothetical protein